MSYELRFKLTIKKHFLLWIQTSVDELLWIGKRFIYNNNVSYKPYLKSDDKSHEVSGRKGADSQDIVTEVSTNDHVEDLNNLKVTNPPPVVTTTTTVAPIKTTKIPRIKTTTVAKSSRFVYFIITDFLKVTKF